MKGKDWGGRLYHQGEEMTSLLRKKKSENTEDKGWAYWKQTLPTLVLLTVTHYLIPVSPQMISYPLVIISLLICGGGVLIRQCSGGGIYWLCSVVEHGFEVLRCLICHSFWNSFISLNMSVQIKKKISLKTKLYKDRESVFFPSVFLAFKRVFGT